MHRNRSHCTQVLFVGLALATGVLATALLGGCSLAKGFAPEGTSTKAPPSVATPGELERMSAETKRSEIATSFPVEVPVVAGEVIRGEAQGGDAWDYQLMVPVAMGDVISWYATAYTRAEWQFIADNEAGSGRKLVFVKGDAESEIIVKSAGAKLTNVIGIVGVGAPVLNTQ